FVFHFSFSVPKQKNLNLKNKAFFIFSFWFWKVFFFLFVHQCFLSILRSALAAAILSSSLTGQTWALPPTRPRAYSVSDQSESFISGPKLSTGLYTSRPRLSSPNLSEDELEDSLQEGERGKNREEEHVYQTLGRQDDCSVKECGDVQPLGMKVRKHNGTLYIECGFHSVLHNLRNTLILVPAGSQAELQSLRKQAQELVDENDALKLTVHRINVELSDYQARFRPRTQQEVGLTKAGSPPPSLFDMKYLSPLFLAYDDKINEKDKLLLTAEEEGKKLRVHAEDVIKENEKLHEKISKMEGAVSQNDCQQLQQQALRVLEENQVLVDQLEAQHVKAKASHSRHQSEVTKVSKQLMLLEAEKQQIQEELEESRREVQRYVKENKVLQTRLKDTISWEEHCSTTDKLRRPKKLPVFLSCLKVTFQRLKLQKTGESGKINLKYYVVGVVRTNGDG
uniref:Centrosomal protein 89 n=1 Tax=Gouania willdenowi TaxID=441366 RepID=A0A8C5HE29_GOUWI